jgi:hypothetical protein
MIVVATAAMPPSRRDWGRAISAELEHASSHGDQLRLVLAAVRIALVPPTASGGYGRAVSRSVALAAIAYVPLGLGLYASNVITPAAPETMAGILTMYGYVLLMMLTVGALARRASTRTGTAVVAGVAAGVALAAFEMGTLAWLDNAFFSVVSQQPEKIQSFRESGMTSMHAYLTATLEATAPALTIAYASVGALFAPIGAALWGSLVSRSSDSPARSGRS